MSRIPHVDVYGWKSIEGQEHFVWNDTPTRHDDVTEVDYLRTTHPETGARVAYFNGYTWRTPPHLDDECHVWKPEPFVTVTVSTQEQA